MNTTFIYTMASYMFRPTTWPSSGWKKHKGWRHKR